MTDSIRARIGALAASVIGQCDYASVAAVDRSGQLHAATHELPFISMVEMIQQHNRGGPSFQALVSGVCVVDDFAADRRWPRLSAWALSHGLRSMFACPIGADEAPAGLLNLYATRPGPFTADVQDRALLLAACAGRTFDDPAAATGGGRERVQ